MDFIKVYDLTNESQFIESVQYATLNKPNFGLKIKDSLLFGTAEWFEAIKKGKIQSFEIDGIIQKIGFSGQNNERVEYIVKDDRTGEEITQNVKGKRKLYQIGKRVRMKYVIQELKKPPSKEYRFQKEFLTIEIEV